jgi:hypothetical protein
MSPARRPTRTLRGLATLLVVIGGVAMVSVSGATAASSKGTTLATLKIRADAVQVKAKDATDYAPAKDGQALKQGDSLKTDATGLAEIAYTDGSLTRLGPSTEFQITTLTSKKGARQTQGTLTVGSTWNRAAKVSESGSFSIKAGGATAAVQGTAFVVTCPPAGSASMQCTVTAIVDSVGVDSDSWDVTSVTNVP